MKRHHLTCALACLLAGAATHAAAQTASGSVADPQAPAPATRAQPAIDYHSEAAPATRPDEAWRAANATVGGRNPMRLTMPGMQPGHDHHAGMDMGAMQCTAGGGCACCGGKDKMPAHDGHGDHGAMQCKPADGGCGCCDHKEGK
jgi:hypothetical protein